MGNTCWVNKWCLGVVLYLGLSLQICAQFENIPITPYALGGSTVAASLGSESVLHNPAGLLGIREHQIEMGYADSFSAVQSGWISMGKRLLKNTVVNLAFPVTMVQHDTTVENNIGQAEVVGGFQDMQAAAIVSVASEVKPGVTLGLNVKYVMHQISTEQSAGFALDAGIQYHNDLLRLGVVIQNVGGFTKTWSTGLSESIPMTIGAGTQFFLPFGVTVLGDVRLTDNTRVIGLGILGTLNQYLTLFGGLADVGVSNTLRMGMALDLSGFTLKYAMSLHEELGVSHRFGLCFTTF